MGATPTSAPMPAPVDSRGHVLVLVHDFQRDHPTLRALRGQAEYTATPLVIVDMADLDQAAPPQLDGCRAIAAIGPDVKRAARLAIDHGLVHLELGDYHESGRLDETLARAPEPRPVVAVTVDGHELAYGLNVVHLECVDPFDIEILGHRWQDIAGPVTVEMSDRRRDATWVTVRDAPALLLSASPPSTSTLDITARGPVTIVTDEYRHQLDGPERITIAFPARHRTLHL